MTVAARLLGQIKTKTQVLWLPVKGYQTIVKQVPIPARLPLGEYRAVATAQIITGPRNPSPIPDQNPGDNADDAVILVAERGTVGAPQ